ncbi:transporter substrate-binding domain-containing protein [Sinorhizobium mexicanum]|uniref:Transporter substrate-binding domain-containing protein n=1 Tax=Sinorhizobium mexicanum TaxID=375549 RepID=A0A859QGK2_9HYPH|nr:transporter substrate-binding domain-containing protein [Sinorhizobium mexicanum]MBP1881757.1 polar amino acid transport system substrate-binding protein [Sinorhizobium mexicanum]QLL61515.1 transporter substrate-binding domain-containing protein [Sinorhizobium mexicanum]
MTMSSQRTNLRKLVTAASLAVCATFPAYADDYPTDPVAAGLVPAALRSEGTLRIAMPDQGKPYNYQEGNELKGMEPDLARAIAATLGLKPEMTLVPYTAALPGLQSDKFSVSFGQFYIRAERLEVVDFVSDWKTFNVFLVTEKSGLRPTDFKDLCGRRAGAMAGTVNLEGLQKNADKCAEGKIDVQAFPSMASAVLALSSGRVDAVFVDPQISREAQKTEKGLVESGTLGEGLTAIAIARNEKTKGLPEAIQAALVHLDKTGEYKKLLTAHETDYGALTQFDIYTKGSTPPVYE